MAPDSPVLATAEDETTEVVNPDNQDVDHPPEEYQETSEPIEFSSPTLDTKEEPDYSRGLETELAETVELAKLLNVGFVESSIMNLTAHTYLTMNAPAQPGDDTSVKLR